MCTCTHVKEIEQNFPNIKFMFLLMVMLLARQEFTIIILYQAFGNYCYRI